MRSLFKKVIQRIRQKPYKEILKQERYCPATVSFLNHSLSIVDNVTFLHGKEEIFDQELYKFNSSSNKPFIIDCGANIGLSVIFFKKLFPDAKIIAFEPDPGIYKVLEKNIRSFKLENVESIEAAIWTEDSFMSFQIEGGFSGSLVNFWDQKAITKVKTVDLSRFINCEVELLKIDIEGAEYEVLKKIKNQLSFVKNIFIEYHSPYNKEQVLQEILGILTDGGFRYHIKEAFTRHQPFISRETMVGMDLQLNIFGYK